MWTPLFASSQTGERIFQESMKVSKTWKVTGFHGTNEQRLSNKSPCELLSSPRESDSPEMARSLLQTSLSSSSPFGQSTTPSQIWSDPIWKKVEILHEVQSYGHWRYYTRVSSFHGLTVYLLERWRANSFKSTKVESWIIDSLSVFMQSSHLKSL
jgi:hypothetical protein